MSTSRQHTNLIIIIIIMIFLDEGKPKQQQQQQQQQMKHLTNGPSMTDNQITEVTPSMTDKL